MSIPKRSKSSQIFNELPAGEQKHIFNFTENKFMPEIDNLYFSVFIKNDNFAETQEKLMPLLDSMVKLKEQAKQTRQPVPFNHNLLLMPDGVRTYTIRLSEPDLYDIYFIPSINLPNDNTNRIHVQLRALGLHTRTKEAMLEESLSRVESILADYGVTIDRVQENRIDYCYHTNIKSSVHKIFEKSGDRRFLKTRLHKGGDDFHIIEDENGYTDFDRHYYIFGKGKANNFVVKMYDKVREVLENGYKSFFFKLWHDNGLISYYDKWCFEYALHYKSVKHLGKARVAFYAAHGKNPVFIEECKKALANKNKTLKDFEVLAKRLTPSTTPVINIEWQTMREFYSHSDKHIERLPTMERNCNPLLKRLYQILDNRELFLNYLHGTGFSFYNGKNEKGEPLYLDWWKRLKNTKIGGIKADEKLLREYSHRLDKSVVARNVIKSHASLACYEDRLVTNLQEDIKYDAEHITDNILHDIDKQYTADKERSNRQIKNRKKNQQEEPPLEPQNNSVDEWIDYSEAFDMDDEALDDIPEEFT